MVKLENNSLVQYVFLWFIYFIFSYYVYFFSWVALVIYKVDTCFRGFQWHSYICQDMWILVVGEELHCATKGIIYIYIYIYMIVIFIVLMCSLVASKFDFWTHGYKLSDIGNIICSLLMGLLGLMAMFLVFKSQLKYWMYAKCND